MAVSQSDLVNLYLAYFGRPPDIDGLNFYSSNSAFTLETVAAAFSASPESQALYGTTFGQAQINAIYQNLFNRDAEPDGVTYWSNEVNSGRISPAFAALAILLGAQNADKVAVQNKVQISGSFLSQLDTPAEMAGYAGDAAAAIARAFLHTVDSSSTSLAVATAALSTQVAAASGLVTLTFSATKSAANVVSFSNPGTAIAVTQADGGGLTFTSSAGVSGSATVTGTIAGISVPTGTTLSIGSALAGSKAFSGGGTALVVASADGEDLTATLTATGVDIIQLASGKNYSLTTEQAAIARIGTAGTLGNLTGSGTITVVGTLETAGGDKAAALKASGADLVAVLLAAGGNYYDTSFTNVDRIWLASGQDYSFSAAQAALISAGDGTQQVTVLNSTVAGLVLSSAVETFKLSNFGNDVTVTGVAQSVSGGSGADTFRVGSAATSGTLDGGGGSSDTLVASGTLGAATVTGFEKLHVAASSDISAVNGGAALGPGLLTMAAGTGLTMTVAQNNDLSGTDAVEGSGQSVSLTDSGSVTAIDGIESYVLAQGSSTFTTTSADVSINAAALADADVLTLTGAVQASVTLVRGDLDAAAYSGNLTVTAGVGTSIVSTGSGDDSISTGAGDDTIDAGGGADTVRGGAGSDTITLGAGADKLVFDSQTGSDTISDFDAGEDLAQLVRSVFSAAGSVGALSSAAFESGSGLTAAATGAGRIVYNTDTGALYYDADGSGGTAAVLIGTFTNTPALTAAHFSII